MIAKYEDELICDMAEVYHIYDYRALPIGYTATLVSGLGHDSRVYKAIAGQPYDLNTYLLAAIADRLSILVWFKTKDGQNGTNKPSSFAEALYGNKQKKDSDLQTFNSFEEMQKAFEKFEKGGK